MNHFPFLGLYFLRVGRASSRLRNDLLWSCERYLLVGVWIFNEIRRQAATHGAGRHRPC